MATQRAFFDDDDTAPEPARSLIARPAPGRKLTRHQQTFNRLVARVERLRVKFDRVKQRFEDALVFHAAEIRPRTERVTRLRQDVALALLSFLDGPGLTRRQKQELDGLLAEQLDEILRLGGSLDAPLAALFTRLHGVSVADVERDQMEDARSALQGMFAEIGLDLDLSRFTPGMSDEELAATAAEMTEDVKRQTEAAETRAGARRPTKQQERARRTEALRKASLGSIYRQLAKLLHPDLEPDADVRARKSALMQEVTAAYARQDLHTLLRLHLEWLHREDADVTRLTDDTLRAYNDMLEEQADELELATEELYFHPKYALLADDAGAFGVRILREGTAQARDLDDRVRSLGEALSRLQGPDGLADVRIILRERRYIRRQRI